MAQKKLGISMRGGMARSTGYLGVLQALVEEGIKVDYVVGSSMGALIGVAFASGFSFDEMSIIVANLRIPKMLSLESIKDLAVLGGNLVVEQIEEIFQNKNLEDTDIKTWVQCTSLEDKEVKFFERGSIARIITATIAFPFFLKPVEIEGRHYIDGDISAGYGADILRANGADVVIGLSGGMRGAKDHTSLAARFSEPLSIALNTIKKKDLEINPLDLLINDLGKDVGTHDFDRAPELVKFGYNKTKELMPEIKKLLDVA